ncbi:hypothetical protein [Brevibacillus choshinensis]|uniref:hypothetical protein n=1 Tax=Brevibacillus choshinensis TaxID=54911 RepID=UPI002E1F9F74|nr:hypothetical protein [Brevibacillus choshinensis]
MGLEHLFGSRIDNLKKKLEFLAADKFPSSYKRIEQPEAKGLLEEIEKLQHEHAEMKEKLEKINLILK